MGNPPAAAGTQTTRLDPAIRSRVRVLVSALPFAIIASIGVSLMVTGPGWGLLPLLAVGSGLRSGNRCGQMTFQRLGLGARQAGSADSSSGHRDRNLP